MLRFARGLLYFFRFHFVFLFVKSYVGWEICTLASHLFCFQSEGGVKILGLVGVVTNLGGIFVGGVSTPLHAMRTPIMRSGYKLDSVTPSSLNQRSSESKYNMWTFWATLRKQRVNIKWFFFENQDYYEDMVDLC